MPNLEQTAYNKTRKEGAGDQGSVYLKTTFATPTTKGRLVIAVAFWTGGLAVGTYFSDSRFSQLLPATFLRDTSMAAWYLQNAPSIANASISMDANRGVVLRLFEISGVAQGSALDKVVWSSGEDNSPYSGQTGTLAQAGEYIFACIGSQYASTSQGSFSGGLSRLYEDIVPDSSNEDWERGRVTFHHGTATSTNAQRLSAYLSTTRRWIGFLCSFRSGVSGPVKFTSTNQNAINVAGRASLTVFGRLKCTLPANNVAFTGVEAARARIGPFDYQYRLGGWNGLLIGSGTSYPVESVEGLEGWVLRNSDADQPRNDGSIRGIDLQMARELVFKVSASLDGASRSVVEARLSALFDALRPQRDEDLELIFRHPGRALRSMYYRPSELTRGLTLLSALSGQQQFGLRCADPRIYSAIIRKVTIPVSPDDSSVVTTVAANNIGNGRAYPIIRVAGTTTDVTRVSLFNATANIAFDVITTLQRGGEIIGDMQARVTGGRSSVVTLNNSSKYGAWQMPREPFYIAPAPEAENGTNVLYLRTVPTGIAVTCTIEYRDTWAG